MDRRVQVGRAFGLSISVDWTWVFTFVLTAWTLIRLGDRFSSAHPAALTLAGVVAAIGLFASLMIHEVAHGLAARACGIPVRHLTLFLFGGMTDVERDPASPRSEVLAASVALSVSAALGVVFLGLAALLPPGLFGLAALWVGGTNLGVALLHVLPAFPLSGGRFVRAAIWRMTGDAERATRWAAWLAQVIGWTGVLGGIAFAFAGKGMFTAAGLWAAFIGWFVASAAAQAYQGVLVQVERAEQAGRQMTSRPIAA